MYSHCGWSFSKPLGCSFSKPFSVDECYNMKGWSTNCQMILLELWLTRCNSYLIFISLIERKKRTITVLNLEDHLCDFTYQIIPLHLFHLQVECQINVIYRKRENHLYIPFDLQCDCQIHLLRRKRKFN